MNTSFENILTLEAANTGSIHLYYYPEHGYWVAYGQSAINLARLVPELKRNLTEELFADYEILLHRLAVNHEQTEQYGLPYHCTLLGDDYARLQEVM